jgi:hypothetical protein
MPDPSQFNTDRTYPGRWTITFSNPPINMFVPTTIVELGALMRSPQESGRGPDFRGILYSPKSDASSRVAVGASFPQQSL